MDHDIANGAPLRWRLQEVNGDIVVLLTLSYLLKGQRKDKSPLKAFWGRKCRKILSPSLKTTACY
jgi:hypothetical protein